MVSLSSKKFQVERKYDNMDGKEVVSLFIS